MSNVTLSVVVPSVEIIFDDDTAAILTAVDADTVLGVTPGTIGLQVLASTTADGALAIIGGASPSAAAALSRQAVGAHATSADPHRVYVKPADLPALIDPVSSARQVLSAHAMAADPHPAYILPAEIPGIIDPINSARQVLSSHAMAANPHPQYPTFDQMQIANAGAMGLIMAHPTSRAAHPDRPTLDQSILQSSFFGG